MQIHSSTASLRAARAQMGRVAFVPTMGNLHAGHLALMRAALEHGDTCVASIFVNRLQFGAGEDFDRYPRSFAEDCAALREAGVAHLFAPDESVMYPAAQNYVLQPDPAHTDLLEGAVRPGHFAGVCTVVLKLLHQVQPEVLLLGKKDYQQCMVLSNMVRQLDLPTRVVGLDTVRAEDGLALSSRNGYLTAAERAEAPRLYAELQGIREALRAGERDFPALEQAARLRLQAHGWQPDYVTIRQRANLQLPTAEGTPQDWVVLAAARLGSTRLIDNLEI